MPTRTRRKRGCAIASLALSTVLLAVILTGVWNGMRPLPIAAAKLSPVTNLEADTIDFRWPGAGSAAAGVVGFGVVGASPDQTPRPTASVAKVITSLAVMEKSPLKLGESGPAYTVSQSDVARYAQYYAVGGSVAKVAAGEQLTQYQALQAVLLPSANNVADSLAVWVFGSLPAYQVYATDMIKRLGLTNTTVGTDASGLSPTTTSTPSDLVLLGQALMQNPVLAEIVGQSTADIPVAGTIYNVDWLLGQEGVVGIKTGNTDEAGGCFLGAATQKLADGTEITIITAVMGSATRNTAMSDTLPLLRSIKPNVTHLTVLKAGQKLGAYTFPWGATATIVAKHDVQLTRWGGYSLATDIATNRLEGPAAKGTKVGTATVRSGQRQFTVDLVLDRAVAGPSLWWRATRH